MNLSLMKRSIALNLQGLVDQQLELIGPQRGGEPRPSAVSPRDAIAAAQPPLRSSFLTLWPWEITQHPALVRHSQWRFGLTALTAEEAGGDGFTCSKARRMSAQRCGGKGLMVKELNSRNGELAPGLTLHHH